MEIAIETTELTKTFGLVKRLTAVNNLSMKIEKGTVHGFIGPNGAGKTTTIKMITGAISPTNGSAQVFGEEAGKNEAKARIGYSPEHPNFYSQSAFDFLVYNARICGVEPSEAKERANNLLDWMGLTDFKNRNARGFSAGMKQKLGLLQSLIHDPDVLILDEPTANLDPIGRFDVLTKIKDLAKKEGKTILVSSHILDELEKVVDHVTIINKGHTVLQSDIHSLKNKFASNKYIVETANNPAYLKRISKLGPAKLNPDGNIEVEVKNPERFKSAIFTMFKNDTKNLGGFYPLKMSLENIFMNVLGDKSDLKNNEQKTVSTLGEKNDK
ncbi:MAG: ABC transporter ATP-binding protein [Candidatus Altiarchaeota archaeon]|nr:ABC transporter ATP-binding protein [Candidatus Altiarchaeota archaeon]